MRCPLLSGAKQIRKKLLLLAAMYLSAIGTMVFSGTDSVLLPKAAEQFGALDYYSVALPLSSIVTIVMMPLSGFLMARNPTIKIKLFVVEWLITVVGGIVMACAQNYAMIVLGMMLARMCFPAVYVCGFTIIRELYDAKQAGIYMGLMNTVMLASNIIVPTLGGAVVDGFGWRWMYVIIAVSAALPAAVAILTHVTYPEYAKGFPPIRLSMPWVSFLLSSPWAASSHSWRLEEVLCPLELPLAGFCWRRRLSDASRLRYPSRRRVMKASFPYLLLKIEMYFASSWGTLRTTLQFSPASFFCRRT